MRDCIARYHHTLSDRVLGKDRERVREAGRMGSVPKFVFERPEVKEDRCAFLKCGNCDNAAVYWKVVNPLYSYWIRKCDVCGEDDNILNGKGQKVRFAVRER